MKCGILNNLDIENNKKKVRRKLEIIKEKKNSCNPKLEMTVSALSKHLKISTW